MRAHISATVDGMSTPADTIWVRRPTAPTGGRRQRTDVPPRPTAGRPHDRPAHRPRLAIVAADREHLGRVPPARRRADDRGRDRRADRPTRVERPQADRRVRRPGRRRDRRARHVRFVHHVHDQGRGHGRGAREAGRRDRVRRVHGARAQRRPARRPRRPEACSCSPTRSKRGPTEELRADRTRLLPEGARAPGRDGMTLASERIEVPADPRAQYELVARRALGRRRPATPGHRRRDRSAARRVAVPRRSRRVRAAAGQRRRDRRARRDQRRDGRRRTRRVRRSCSPRSKRCRSRSGTRSGSPPRRRACSRCSSSTGRAATMLGIDYRASCMGGAAGRGSMTIGRAVALCLRNIGGQRAGETTKSVFGQPARFGFCIGEWEERSPWPSLARAPRLHRRRRRRDRARRQGHVPDGRHPQRRPARSALPHRQEHGVPAREHVPRQRRER